MFDCLQQQLPRRASGVRGLWNPMKLVDRATNGAASARTAQHVCPGPATDDVLSTAVHHHVITAHPIMNLARVYTTIIQYTRIVKIAPVVSVRACGVFVFVRVSGPNLLLLLLLILLLYMYLFCACVKIIIIKKKWRYVITCRPSALKTNRRFRIIN